MAANKQGEQRRGAELALERPRVRIQEKRVVEEITDVCMDDDGRDYGPTVAFFLDLLQRTLCHNIPVLKR